MGISIYLIYRIYQLSVKLFIYGPSLLHIFLRVCHEKNINFILQQRLVEIASLCIIYQGEHSVDKICSENIIRIPKGVTAKMHSCIRSSKFVVNSPLFIMGGKHKNFYDSLIKWVKCPDFSK